MRPTATMVSGIPPEGDGGTKTGLAAFDLRWIEKTSGFYASMKRCIDKDNAWEVSRRRWIDKNRCLEASRKRWIEKTTGLEASRMRWIEKTSSLEASRTLRDDLEGLKHYACSVFCGPGDATRASKVASSRYPGPPKPYNFYMITSNISWDWD